MIDILVVSQAAFIALNRKVYNELRKDGWNIEVVAPISLMFPTGIKKANPPTDVDLPIHFLELSGTNPRIYKFVGLTALLELKKPRIVLVDNDPVSKLSLELGLWCKKNNSKLFCISCENLSLKVMDAFRRRGWRGILPTLMKRYLISRTKKVVSGVFTINSDGKDLFEKEGFKNVHQIPLGFDENIFFPNAEFRHQIRESLNLQHTVIAYFGRMIPEKGIHILIQALSTLKELEWHFMMDHFDEYATDYNKEIAKLIAQANIADRLIYVNPDHYQIAKYMNAADVIVIPSQTTSNWKEQYGRVAAEALACGRTVIVSNSGALPDLIKGNGLIFKEGNVRELADLIANEISMDKKNGAVVSVAQYAVEELSVSKQKSIMSDVLTNSLERQ